MRRRKFTDFERSFIEERAGHCCEYCKFPMSFSHDPFHIEHILALHLGGTNDMVNLALACDGCNSYKWQYIEALDSETNTIVPLFNPRLEAWQAHFEWSSDFKWIHGKTPKGRATIDLLRMNRSGLVNIREALIAFGVKPLHS
jgi:hypothetical protein